MMCSDLSYAFIVPQRCHCDGHVLMSVEARIDHGNAR